MKICVLTQALRNNYGGLLQAYALQVVLKHMGHSVVTDRHTLLFQSLKIRNFTFPKKIFRFTYQAFLRYIIRKKKSNPFKFLFTSYLKQMLPSDETQENCKHFIDKHIETVHFFHPDHFNLDYIQQNYDAIIVGSDQVWNPMSLPSDTYFLDFTSSIQIKRIAYAASFGKDSFRNDEATLLYECEKYAVKFDAISVREDTAVDICDKYLKVKATHLLDPTMLLDKEQYLPLLNKDNNKDVRLLSYILDHSPENEQILNTIGARLDSQALIMTTAESVKSQDRIAPTINDWLTYFSKSEFVVTDSFHGTVFAIIFNKNFICINNTKRGSSRFTSLLKIFNLQNRLVESVDDIREEHFESIDYTVVNEIKSQWLKKSLDFLSNSLHEQPIKPAL